MPVITDKVHVVAWLLDACFSCPHIEIGLRCTFSILLPSRCAQTSEHWRTARVGGGIFPVSTRVPSCPVTYLFISHVCLDVVTFTHIWWPEGRHTVGFTHLNFKLMSSCFICFTCTVQNDISSLFFLTDMLASSKFSALWQHSACLSPDVSNLTTIPKHCPNCNCQNHITEQMTTPLIFGTTPLIFGVCSCHKAQTRTTNKKTFQVLYQKCIAETARYLRQKRQHTRQKMSGATQEHTDQGVWHRVHCCVVRYGVLPLC